MSLTIDLRTKNLTGLTFGRWTVGAPVRIKAYEGLRWHCRCECGTEAVIVGASLRSGNSKSCGCHKRELQSARKLTHGQTNSREWHTWINMRRRCRDPQHPAFPGYGGRGIFVCGEWEEFQAFLNDMGPRPPRMTLDRIDNDGPYAPWNCRWATKKEQARNSRRVQNVTIGPLTMCIAAWAEESGKDANRIRAELLRGENPARAVYG